MNKLNKILLSLGSMVAVVAPMGAVISCGSSDNGVTFNDINSIKTGGYSDSMKKLETGDITAAGSWGDTRFYAATPSSLHVVGIEKYRIANDGIQVRGDLNANDQLGLQHLFQDLIEIANKQKAAAISANPAVLPGTNSGLIMLSKGKIKTLFEVYSHSGYTAPKNDQKIGILDGGELIEVPAMSGSVKPSASFDATTSEFFAKASKISTITASTTLSTNYQTKSGKEFRIKFIPSNDPAQITEATKKLKSFLDGQGVKVNISVASDYDSAGSALENKQLEMAFLPAGTWRQSAPHSNFILQAARPTQISTLSLSGTKAKLATTKIESEQTAVKLFNKYGRLYLNKITSAALGGSNLSTAQAAFKAAMATPASDESKISAFANSATKNDMLSGSYEAWIYTKTGSAFDKAIVAKNSTANWKLDLKSVHDKLKYGYTSTTSGASYEYPELWFNEHFTK